MTTPFRLPDLGEGVHEAEILAVPVTAGQEVQEGDLILEVETDKAAVEIPSPITGTVSALHVQPGDIAKVGDILITFETGKVAPAKEPEEATKTAPVAAPQKQAASADTGKKRPVPASPSTRRLAREMGVDLHLVPATGSKGLVTAEDVRNFAAGGPKAETQPATPTPPPEAVPAAAPAAIPDSFRTLPDFSQWGEVERQPFRSIRRATANRMAASWAQIPHVNCQDMVDITRLDDFRRRHKDEIAAAGGRLTMTVFALKAAATALKSYPQFNASLDLEAQEIIVKKYYHIGVAVDTDHGLVVPVIRDVDRKSIRELSIEVQEAIVRAKERKSTREELVGGTFTLTNAGAIGGGFFSAIINYPEIAILGLGRARMQPAVVTGTNGRHEIVPRLMMPLVLCFDHRVVDGADAIRFMQVIIDLLQDPDELLITMI